MMRVPVPAGFTEWRDTARVLLGNEIKPQTISWDDSPLIPAVNISALSGCGAQFVIGKSNLEQFRLASHHRSPARWALLYRLIWRLTHEEPRLLDLPTDPDVLDLQTMCRQVTRDAHKAKAFIRFRKLEKDGTELYTAWHKPDHFILHLVAPFFVRRFGSMNWVIMTPDETASWDQRELSYSAGVPEQKLDDEIERLWLSYYSAIFNPARVNESAMKKEMPRRYWGTLPEARIIPDLIRTAPQRTAEMVKKSDTVTEKLSDRLSLSGVKRKAAVCTRCPLYLKGTQTVFGEGKADSKLMLVGEQPGDQEDLKGKPFIGPAGGVLKGIMDDLEIERDEVYLTNAVKHFSWIPRGKRRIHQKPKASEINACNIWLDAEIRKVAPKVILCLGSTAAQSVLGRQTRIEENEGKILSSQYGIPIIVTYHPSAMLRAPDDRRAEILRKITKALKKARALADKGD